MKMTDTSVSIPKDSSNIRVTKHVLTFVTVPQVEIKNNKDHKEDVENDEHEEHDPYFEPIIHLPEVHIYSMEEDEEDLVKLYYSV